MQVVQPELDLEVPVPDPDVRWLSPNCLLQRDGDVIVVVVGGSPLFRCDASNRTEYLGVAAMLAEGKVVPIKVITDAFNVTVSALWRARQRVRAKGISGVIPDRRGRKKGPYKLVPLVVRRILELRERGLKVREIARRLLLGVGSVHRVLKQAGDAEEAEEKIESGHLPFEDEAPSEEDPEPAEKTDGDLSEDPDVVLDTEAEGQEETSAPAAAEEEEESGPILVSQEVAAGYASLGLSLDGEAEVVFESRLAVPAAGLLLTIPALQATGLLEAVRSVYGSLRKGIYGLRSIVMVLTALAFLRRPRPENLKEMDPAALGDVLGLLRAPEVKTSRRKLEEIAECQKAHELAQELARRWMAEVDDVLGVFYVDGHVRVYHGKHKLPKTHYSQKNLSVPATTDYWVNGATGDPIFVVTAAANAHMTKMIPELLDEMEVLGKGRRGTLVFDRAGWSAKLFKKIRDRKWHILTYRKGELRLHPRKGFSEQSMVIDGREVRYTLSERTVRLDGLKLREIAELRDDGGQTIFLTSHFDQPAVLLAHRMFGRWRQENYFRYMKENFALDALVDYGVVPDDPDRMVPNPARKKIQKQILAARAELAALEREYGAAAADNQESKRPTMRGFKIANGATGQALRAARERVAALEKRRSKLPDRVPIAVALGDADKVVKLAPERKLFTDLIRAACYRAETMLLTLLRPHFPRADDEGRAFLRAVMQQPGDIAVVGNTVTVTYAPMSAPRFTAALQSLCNELNRLEPRYPETSYRLHYAVREVASCS